MYFICGIVHRLITNFFFSVTGVRQPPLPVRLTTHASEATTHASEATIHASEATTHASEVSG